MNRHCKHVFTVSRWERAPVYMELRLMHDFLGASESIAANITPSEIADTAIYTTQAHLRNVGVGRQVIFFDGNRFLGDRGGNSSDDLNKREVRRHM